MLLVRRGRWAVGVFDGADLVVSKVDARQVQGRTAAGGWSQQRFARRRGNQTDAVVEHAVETAVRVLLPHAGEVVALFTGGDRGLVDEVLADSRLRALASLRREPHLDVGEPTKAVLLETPKQFRAVDVHSRSSPTSAALRRQGSVQRRWGRVESRDGSYAAAVIASGRTVT